MTRQEAVIKLAKITRIIGEIKYRLDLDGEVELESVSPELLSIGKWTKEIRQYIKKDKSPQLARLISNIGFTELIENYVKEHKTEIEPVYVEAVESYVENMKALLATCDENSKARRGQFQDLIEPLATEQVAELMQRAIDAGILDKHYQPVPGIKVLQLRIIAYAISSICKFHSQYVYFERQWHREGNYRIGNAKIPRYDTSVYDETKALYPEVDFSSMEGSTDAQTFYARQGTEDRKELYKNLVKNGYVSKDTSFQVFNGIFTDARFVAPVEWLKTQRQLAYFIYTVFYKYNTKNIWNKCKYCFRVDGKEPHKDSIVTGFNGLKRSGLLDRYDVRLKAICDKFNHTENTVDTDANTDGRLIHTSKVVFHSTNSDKDKRAMYSSLLKGEYIDTQTTFAIFKGIFDETKFVHPITWTKSQTQLMYFVHLAFKADNPFDVWVKCVHCFRLKDGKQPNRVSLDSNFRIFVKKGLVDTYNTELKSIADNYNRTKEKEKKAPHTEAAHNH